MIINRGGVRELFRYSLASLSSVSIIVYILFSAISVLFPKHNHETLSSIFIMDETTQTCNDGELTIDYSGDNEDYINFGSKRSLKAIHKKLSMINTLSIDNNSHNANQFLQNGNNFDISHDNEFVEGNPFDIERIITDLHLPKEKRVAVIAKELGVDWKDERGDYAKLAGIEGNYNGSLEQNQKIRNYLIANAQEIYKEKHGWNERDTLDLVPQKNKEIKLNTREITGQVTYNNVTLKVSAPIESFPEGTILKIKTLGDDDSLTKLDITLKEVILMTQVDSVEFDAPMVSFDISFYAPDDIEFIEELQPAEGKFISVVFDYANNNEFKNTDDEGFLAIYHMEDSNNTSVANLVSVKDSEDLNKNSKSDSMGIYANTLSVYILTVVSDLDKDISENDKTITFDAGSGGSIIDGNNIILSSTEINADSIYTGKILSKDNEIILPDIQFSGGNFGGRYDKGKFLGNAQTTLKLGDSDDSEGRYSDYKIYACLYTEESGGNSCTFGGEINYNLHELNQSLVNENISDSELYTPSDEEIWRYGQEVFDAYNWAIKNGVTTIDDISKAKLNTNVTRAELAKMMVVFMSGILQKEPIITGDANYKDVNTKKLGDLAGYIELAYQYQIMGINADGSPMKNFNPNKSVSRAEFSTVLSRVLFGNMYNQSGDNYYEKHIDALNKANILNDVNPDITEWRGWIMTMLYRSQL